MGGNAIKSSQRMDKTTYFKLARELVSFFARSLPDAQICVIESYSSKSTFGDIDILVSEKPSLEMLDFLNPVEVVNNGDVRSIGLPTMDIVAQADIIYIPEEYFDFAKNYFAFNDLGNLIGRVAHAMGFKFGHNGLWLRSAENTGFKDVLITSEFDKALKFLGFDQSEHMAGFETLEDVFEYVTFSKYFNPSIYLLESRDYKSRIRDAKRKTYTQFLSYIWSFSGSFFEFPEDKEGWKYLAMDQFKDFEARYSEVVSKYRSTKNTNGSIKEKFNGDLVKEWTGYSGKDLGLEIKYFVDSFSSTTDFATFVLTHSPLEVRERFEENRHK